jgi:hypothetical protein
VLFSDIQFWNKNKSMEGLSAKSVILNFVCQLIVFLYLLDNDTSWMILASSGIGVCIEFWKIGKAMHIEVNGIYGSLSPWICSTKYALWFFTRKLNIFGNNKRSSWLKNGDTKPKIINIRKMFSVIHCHLIVHLQYQLALHAFSGAQFYFMLNCCDHWPSMCFDILDDLRMLNFATCILCDNLLFVGVDICILLLHHDIAYIE